MLKKVLPFLVAFIVAQVSCVRAASIKSTPWEKVNANALNALEKIDVATFLSEVTEFGLALHADCACVKPGDIREFKWADLRGDGRLELVAILDVNGRKFFNSLVILRRGANGNVKYQELRGWMIADLGNVIRDLNGDGQDELIIPAVLYQYNTAGTYTWPVVYRLEKGKYIQASSDFPRFYDAEVLPTLQKQICDYQSKPASFRRINLDTAAMLIFERDKILRMLGRNPTAGLQEAYQWMNTDDPLLLLAATNIFNDIPGHREEANAARAAYDRASSEPAPTGKNDGLVEGSGAGCSPTTAVVNHEPAAGQQGVGAAGHNGVAIHPGS
ncbi:hypothetical protein IMX07_01355 [bacterium]|jgi:hypothetical protein|nr:hypothetical protein [bacterium]